MKVSVLRKKSLQPIPRLKSKADRQLQDWHRNKYPNQKCEGECGRHFDVMHHFIEKSRSSRLRYEEINLVFLCHHCHSLHHRFGDSTIHAKIVLKRGAEWFGKIETLRREYLDINNRKFLEGILVRYAIDS